MIQFEVLSFRVLKTIAAYGVLHNFFVLNLDVEVNLAAPNFVPGKKVYERVRWCLKDNLPLTFKFLMSWTNEGRQRHTAW